MSLRTMFDREVTITPRVVDGKDARGNDVIVDGEPFTTDALRDLIDEDEDLDQRDQQTRTYRYLVRARSATTGELLTITGFDRVTDGPDLLEIVGSPKYVIARRRRRVHHVEIVARIVGPGSDAP